MEEHCCTTHACCYNAEQCYQIPLITLVFYLGCAAEAGAGVLLKLEKSANSLFVAADGLALGASPLGLKSPKLSFAAADEKSAN